MRFSRFFCSRRVGVRERPRAAPGGAADVAPRARQRRFASRRDRRPRLHPLHELAVIARVDLGRASSTRIMFSATRSMK